MQKAEKIASDMYSAKDNLKGSLGVLEKLHDAVSSIRSASAVDESLLGVLLAVEDAYYNLEDAAETVADKADGLSFEPDELERVEDRLALIRSLRRKYGADEAAILSYLDDIKAQYEELDNMEYKAEELERELSKAKELLAEDCAKLSALRKKHASMLEKLIDKELHDLGMPSAKFTVEFELVKPALNGVDDIEFFVTLNEGEPAKALTKVASGGEASRIMLAFKGIMASKEDVGTLIFDEIDTGISGRMAKVVAEKMANIALERQVICVTHLPQIAAMADESFLIEKSVDDKGTKTEIRRLDDEERISEVARLSGGSATDAAYAHAKELLGECRDFKNNR